MSAPDLGLLASQAYPEKQRDREREREREDPVHVLVHFGGSSTGPSATGKN